METSSTSAFAGFALQVICRQEWVREKCLEDPQMLCSSELLLDPAISSTQVTVEVKNQRFRDATELTISGIEYWQVLYFTLSTCRLENYFT